MRSFSTRLLGVIADVDYEYEPPERADETSPGCKSDAEIVNVMLCQDDDRIALSVDDIDECIYEALRKEAIEDAESNEP